MNSAPTATIHVFYQTGFSLDKPVKSVLNESFPGEEMSLDERFANPHYLGLAWADVGIRINEGPRKDEVNGHLGEPLGEKYSIVVVSPIVLVKSLEAIGEPKTPRRGYYSQVRDFMGNVIAFMPDDGLLIVVGSREFIDEDFHYVRQIVTDSLGLSHAQNHYANFSPNVVQASMARLERKIDGFFSPTSRHS